MKPRPRPSAAAMIDDDFLRTFEHLARADAPAITALLPEIAAFPPHHHLVALGMAATIVTQSHMHALAGGRYRLIVRSRADHDVSLTVQSRNSDSGISLRLIWNEVLYIGAEHSALRPETAALLQEHASSPLYAEEGDQVKGFYATLRETFTAQPYTNVLRRLAHLPVMLQDVGTEQGYSNTRKAEVEAQRRLALLYRPNEEIHVHLGEEPSLKA